MTDAAATLAGALVLGPLPLDRAEERLQTLVGDLEGDRLSQAAIRLDLSMILALRGSLPQARTEAERAQEVFRDLGQRWWLTRADQALAEIAKEEGNFPEAIERHRAVHASFLEQGDAVNAVPAGLALADTLLNAGLPAEADALAAEAQNEASQDDLEAQVAWRQIRAVAAARLGDPGSALAFAEEAVLLAEPSDFLLMRSES